MRALLADESTASEQGSVGRDDATGTYFYVLDLPPWPDGRRRQRRRGGFVRRKDAAAALRAEATALEPGVSTAEDELTVGVLLERWRAAVEAEWSDKTASWHRVIHHHLDRIADLPWDDGAHVDLSRPAR